MTPQQREVVEALRRGAHVEVTVGRPRGVKYRPGMSLRHAWLVLPAERIRLRNQLLDSLAKLGVFDADVPAVTDAADTGVQTTVLRGSSRLPHLTMKET